MPLTLPISFAIVVLHSLVEYRDPVFQIFGIRIVLQHRLQPRRSRPGLHPDVIAYDQLRRAKTVKMIKREDARGFLEFVQAQIVAACRKMPIGCEVGRRVENPNSEQRDPPQFRR